MSPIQPPQSEPEGAKPGGMLKGVAWMLGFRMFDRAAGLISVLVLARLLLPEHFGVVALASGVVAFIELLAATGLDTVLIQRRDLTRQHYDTAWTIQLGIGMLCALLLCGVAGPAAAFFREPRLAPVMYALALGLLFDGAVNIRIVDFRREMRFDKDFLFMATRRLVALAATITAAVALRNEWALAIGIVSSRGAGALMSYAMCPYLPRLTLTMRHELLGKSIWLLFNNTVQFARQRAAEFVLGRMGGAGSVGMYLLASDLANTASMELVTPINRVALPDFGSHTTREALASRFDVVTGQLAIVLTPLCFGLSACADLVVALLFGDKWAGSADVLRILAIAGWIAGMGSNIGVGFYSLGMFRTGAWITAFGAAALMPPLLTGVHFMGAKGAALAVLFANSATVLAALFVSVKAMGYGPIDFAKRIWRPVVAAALMTGPIYLVGTYLGVPATVGEVGLHLAAQVCAGGVAYLMLLLLLCLLCNATDGAERQTLNLIVKLWRRMRIAEVAHKP